MPPALLDKSIVIIGGTTGIGRSAARAFFQAGAKLFIVGLDPESCAETANEFAGNAAVHCGDARDPMTSTKAIAAAVKGNGHLDGLYHVAGGSGRRFGDGPLHEISDEGWARTIELNLTSVAFSNRASIQQFLVQGTGGAILNLASVLAFSPSPAHFATHAYATAKAGIIGLSKAASAQYAAMDIRVNVLAPGLVDTPMAQRAATDPAIQRFIQTKQPLGGGRIGTPNDLDGAAVFLLSDAARFCTGQVLAVDGGWCQSEGQIVAE